MGMSVNTNVQSMNAQRNLGGSQSALATSMQRLSSGLRVNSAKDDAAGLAIAERAFGVAPAVLLEELAAGGEPAAGGERGGGGGLTHGRHCRPSRRTRNRR